MLIRKIFLKKCLHFVTFYKADTLYRCEFVFYFFSLYTRVLYWTTLSRNSKYVQCIKIKTFKFHLTTCESTFKLLLVMSLANDSSTTLF